MSEERLNEIKDSIELQMQVQQAVGYKNRYDDLLIEEIDLYNEVINLQQENARLKEERNQIKEYVEKCNFDNAEILYDFGSEYCYIDDFKEHILEILKEN